MMESYGCVLITNKNSLLCSKLSKSSREKCFKNKITHSVWAELFLSIVVDDIVIVVHFQYEDMRCLLVRVLWENQKNIFDKFFFFSPQYMSTLMSLFPLLLLMYLREFAHKLEMFSITFLFHSFTPRENLSFEFIFLSNYLTSTEICIHIRTVKLKCVRYLSAICEQFLEHIYVV